MSKTITADEAVNANIKHDVTLPITPASDATGTVLTAVTPYITVREMGTEGIHSTEFTLTDLPLTITKTEQDGGQQIYTFPKGKIARLAAGADLSFTTTTAVASTLNASKTCLYGVGTTTAATTSLTTTECDLVNAATWTSGATINVANTAVKGYGVGSLTLLDGSSTAIKSFLNTSVATAADIDGDATVTVSGTITMHWIKV